MVQLLPHGLAALCHCVPRGIVWMYLKTLSQQWKRQRWARKVKSDQLFSVKITAFNRCVNAALDLRFLSSRLFFYVLSIFGIHFLHFLYPYNSHWIIMDQCCIYGTRCNEGSVTSICVKNNVKWSFNESWSEIGKKIILGYKCNFVKIGW